MKLIINLLNINYYRNIGYIHRHSYFKIFSPFINISFLIIYNILTFILDAASDAKNTFDNLKMELTNISGGKMQHKQEHRSRQHFDSACTMLVQSFRKTHRDVETD